MLTTATRSTLILSLTVCYFNSLISMEKHIEAKPSVIYNAFAQKKKTVIANKDGKHEPLNALFTPEEIKHFAAQDHPVSNEWRKQAAAMNFYNHSLLQWQMDLPGPIQSANGTILN